MPSFHHIFQFSCGSTGLDCILIKEKFNLKFFFRNISKINFYVREINKPVENTQR